MNSLFGLLLKKQAGIIVSGMLDTAQQQRADLQAALGRDEADQLITETVSVIRQVDTASAGKVIQALLEMSAIGAIQGWVKDE